MGKIHMLDEAATARIQRVCRPRITRRYTWCGLIEKIKSPIMILEFADSGEVEMVTCCECIAILQFSAWAGNL